MEAILAYLQHQALLLWLVLAAGWAWSGLNRRRERLRRVALRRAAATANSSASTATAAAADARKPDAQAPAPPPPPFPPPAPPVPLPPVSVVMPVKGCRPHSLANWESHLGATYDGPIEFVFVVESLDDPAVPVLQQLAAAAPAVAGAAPAAAGAAAGPQQAAVAAPPGSQPRCRRRVRIVVAGLATTCSQKAHNLCAGIEACSSLAGWADDAAAAEQAAAAAAATATATATAATAAPTAPAATASVQQPQRHTSAVAADARAEHAEDGGWVVVEGGRGGSSTTAVATTATATTSDAAAATTATAAAPATGSSTSTSATTSTAAAAAAAAATATATATAATAAGGYVLCLDDDVQLHPGSVRELVGEMEADTGLFMATGYPFDVLPPGSRLPAHLAAVYHLPLLIAFSVRPDTAFVWGGCMALRRRALVPGDPTGLLRAWRDGGYSDDLIAASHCTQRRLRIRVPPFAIFPQRLDPRMTWRQWLNYLHRQLFVLDTYAGAHNRATNHTLMALHSLLSWLLVLPSLAALATALSRLCGLAGVAAAAALPPLLRLLLLMLGGGGSLAEQQQQQLLLLQPLLQPLQSLAALALPPQLLLPLQSCLGQLAEAVAPAAAAGAVAPDDAVAGAATASGLASGSVAAAAARLGSLLLQLFPSGVMAVALGWALAHAALVFMTAEILGLFRELSPQQQQQPTTQHPSSTTTSSSAPSASPSSASPSPSPSTVPSAPSYDRALPLLCWYRWGRLWLGLLAANTALPPLMAWAYLWPQVEWGGVLYHKRRGRVVPVRRRLYSGGPWGPPLATPGDAAAAAAAAGTAPGTVAAASGTIPGTAAAAASGTAVAAPPPATS